MQGYNRPAPGQTFFRPQCDDDFCLGIHIDAKTTAIIIGLCLAQTGDALGCRITVRIGFLRHFAQLVDDVLRRRQIGVAHAEINNVFSDRSRRCPHVIDFSNHIGWQAFDTVELFRH